MALISVIIPSYNNFAGLLRALMSISLQTGNECFSYEIIIINDASADKKYHTHKFDENVSLIHLDQHIGRIPTLCQMGHKQASGDFIAFLLDDHSWPMSKIDYQVYDMITHGKKYSYGTTISDLMILKGEPFPL